MNSHKNNKKKKLKINENVKETKKILFLKELLIVKYEGKKTLPAANNLLILRG